MLLGALMLHGVTPGPMITFEHPNFIIEVAAILLLASMAMWVVGMLLAKQVVKDFPPAPTRSPVARLVTAASFPFSMICTAGADHPGGALSAADIVTALYFRMMRINPQNPTWSDRDRFILLYPA